MDMALDDKGALVGGASKGIGRAIALGLLKEGARVMISSRSAENLEAAAAALREETGREVEVAVCDMASHEDITKTVALAADKLGRLDIVVNNAGGPPTGAFQDLDERYWQHAIDQNLFSAVRRIINITSVSVKQPIDGLILSNATRLGVVGLAKTLSRELAPHGITVNNICPGNIATERLMALIEERARRLGQTLEEAVSLEEGRVPMGFLGEADDVANLAVFLASGPARFITGTTIQVDGGSTTAVF
jgi:3-oxoacyl-[acyl-carrier protein] reductase